MYAPRVFVSMAGALLAIWVALSWVTGSFVTALWQTVLCAVILQVGYFIGILYLVRREHQKRQSEDHGMVAAHRVGEARRTDDRLAEAPSNLKATEL